jgi:hypothetical protein
MFVFADSCAFPPLFRRIPLPRAERGVPDSTTCTDRRRHLSDEATSTPNPRAFALTPDIT